MPFFKKIGKHICGWVLYFLISEVSGIIAYFQHIIGIKYVILGVIEYAIIEAPFFYFILLYLNPKFLIKKRYVLFILWIVLLFPVYNLMLTYYLSFWDTLVPSIATHILNLNNKPVSFLNILPHAYLIYEYDMPVFIGFCLLQNSLKQNEELTIRNEQLKQQQSEIETLTKAKSEVEYKLLNSQINPHFLYNALNAFYTRAATYNEELASGIATLSDVMRYALSANLRSDGRVLLSEEVEHIRNVIDIYRLRFEDNIFLNFTVNGNMKGVYIQPLVLITLAENVFKHGNIHLRDFPATMLLTVTDTQIRFETWNKNKKGIKESGTGIGVHNARVRLDNAYKNKYRIETRNTGEEYFALLEINYK